MAVEESAAPINDRSGLGLAACLCCAMSRRHVSTSNGVPGGRPRRAQACWNWRGFESHVQAGVVRRRRRRAVRQVLCYMDLDGFKLVNDTAGHQAGRRVARSARQAVEAKVRNNDILGRLGGDEFGQLLRGCEGARAELIAADVLEAVNEVNFAYQGNLFKIGVSIGLTVITSDHAGVAEIFGEADCASLLPWPRMNRARIACSGMLPMTPDWRRGGVRQAGCNASAMPRSEDRFVPLPPGLQGARPRRRAGQNT
ncbi:MAG: diguanylate cyclase [Ideonella sp.]|nr:diguanylate cyclase [Ideonella sp.]